MKHFSNHTTKNRQRDKHHPSILLNNVAITGCSLLCLRSSVMFLVFLIVFPFFLSCSGSLFQLSNVSFPLSPNIMTLFLDSLDYFLARFYFWLYCLLSPLL